MTLKSREKQALLLVQKMSDSENSHKKNLCYQSQQENIYTAQATFISQSEQKQPAAYQSKENYQTANQRKHDHHQPIVAKKTFITQS